MVHLISPYSYVGIPQSRKTPPTIEEIISEVCATTGVTLKRLQHSTRKRDVVKVRHMCLRLIRDFEIEVSDVQIGKIFCRDRTSIPSSIVSFTNSLLTDNELKFTYEKIKYRLSKTDFFKNKMV